MILWNEMLLENAKHAVNSLSKNFDSGCVIYPKASFFNSQYFTEADTARFSPYGED